MLRFTNLASGSKGNATLVQATDGLGTKTNLLVDCGLSRKELFGRISQVGLAPPDLHGIFITHEHADHIAGAFQVALHLNIPVFMGQGTWRAVCLSEEKGSGATPVAAKRAALAQAMGLVRFVRDEETTSLRGLSFTSITVPHDAREPLQLICSDGAKKIGLLTDLGHISKHVQHHFSGCSAMMIECNHDDLLLEQSKYPAFLRQRIGGDFGHLSNKQSAQAMQAWMHTGLKNILCAHISEQNNHPELVRASMASALHCHEREILCALQTEPSCWLEA